MSEENRIAEEAYMRDMEEQITLQGEMLLQEQPQEQAVQEEAVQGQVQTEAVPTVRQKAKKPRKTLKGNRFVKLLAYILLIYSCLAAVFLVVTSIYFYDRGMYSANQENFYKQMIYPMILEDRMKVLDAVHNNELDELDNSLVNSNLSYIYHDKEYEEVYLNHPGGSEKQFVTYNFVDYRYNGGDEANNKYLELYVRKAPVFNDRYAKASDVASAVYPYRHTMPLLAAIHILLALGLFYFLMCAAGHENGREGISQSAFGKVPIEIITAVFVCGILMGWWAVEECYTDDMVMMMMVIAAMMILGIIWCMAYLTEIARRWKNETFLKNSLIYWFLSGLYNVIDSLLSVGAGMISGVPLVIKTILVFLILCVLEFFGLLLWGSEELVLLWIFEKVILFPVCVYVAIVCKKLLKGTEALAEGHLSYKVNTEKMFGDFKEHGDNLNRISEGISKAVDERLRSEHMKTELITNVSHDIKTPLTSIINYADLLGNAATDNEQVKEYSEVLLRQSKRMKKLLDDLLEASKATTGTLECNFMPCEIGVLLTQACGEYEQRFAESNLELILNKPEQEMTVLADGKHMWRVFDNLLNNICKYSQEHSRVYLSVAQMDNKAEIVFRNMSKYALNISAEELEERFVRGDKSRHMEGNGLGLSITRSLVELQNGTMQVLTDGDLFKVILQFEMYQEI